LLLAAALVLLAGLGVFLVKAKWKNLLNRHDLPSQLAKNIQQEANGYTFVHAYGAHSQYRIHASKEVVLKNDRVELHDVEIDLFGEDGSRVDRIAGDTFEYDQKSGLATAKGPVVMLLTRPAGGVKAAAKEKGQAIVAAAMTADSAYQIEVKTSGVTFDRSTGLVTTGERVDFSLKQGQGSATGARFDSESGYLTLERSVELTTHRGGDLVEIRASHGEFDRGAQTAHLRDAEARYRGGQAMAAQATVLFRPDGTAERLDALGGFTLSTMKGGRLAAPRGNMEFDEHNEPRHGRLEGGVMMDESNEGRSMHGASPEAEMEFTAQGLLKSAHLERGVTIESEEKSGAEAGESEALDVRRTWNSPMVDIGFSQPRRGGPAQGSGKGSVEPATMRGTGGVTIASEVRRGNGAAMPSKMIADEVTGTFGPGGTLRTITGVGHAEIEQTTATGTRQTATGERLVAQLAEDREQGSKGARERSLGSRSKPGASAGTLDVRWAELDGHVVLVETPAAKAGAGGGRSAAGGLNLGAQPQAPLRATAGRAMYEDTGQWLHLTIDPRVENGGLQLAAEKVDVSRESGDAFARGNVKATWTDTGAGGGAGQASGAGGEGRSGLTLGGKGPAHVVAAEAQLNQSTGEATFRGHARLWQQANSVSGPAIVLNQHLQTLTAHSADAAEPVRAVLLSASAPEAGGGRNGQQAADRSTGAKASAPPVIRVRGGELWYSDAERRAVIRGGDLGAVTVETGTATSSSDAVELRLMPAGAHDAGSAGQAQVDRMTATGHVVLTAQSRRGTGERLEYSGASGEYVLTGTAAAPPKMSDPVRGTVTGEALIFHTRDDSVSIEGGGRGTKTETTAPEAHRK
jgi:lipopolysaccharide export system protein LptA